MTSDPRQLRNPNVTYGAWDGTQDDMFTSSDELLRKLTDDLLYHGDINAALRKLLQDGVRSENDLSNLVGLRELLQELQEKRQQLLDRFNADDPLAKYANELNDLLNAERASLDGRSAANTDDGLAPADAFERQIQLDLMPSGVAAQVRSLTDYNFASNEAAQRYEQLRNDLRDEFTQQAFGAMQSALQDAASPQGQAQRERVAAAYGALNDLLEAKARGGDTEAGFDQMMTEYEDVFGSEATTLEELLDEMLARAVAAQTLMNSMSPEQRAELQALQSQLLGDLNLDWQAERLRQNLRGHAPQAGWEQRHRFQGDEPLQISDTQDVMSQLGQMDSLEKMMRSATSPAGLAEIDIDAARRLLGDEAAKSLEKLSELAQRLQDDGLLDSRNGKQELTPKALRRIGQLALREMFSQLAKDRVGRHESTELGAGHERLYETKAYEYGDPFNLDLNGTVRNALRRNGPGTPLRLTPEDFEVERTESLTSTSTVLLLDLSLSMPMRNNFLAAKKVAVALQALIASRYPRDYMGIVGFGLTARTLTAAQLPSISWDFDYGTNMQHAFSLARKLLARHSGTKQIIMITDGEPTAHIPAGSTEAEFNYPPTQDTIDATMAEVLRCTREQIRINTFMLEPDDGLRDFIERLTAINHGRAFFTSPETLGEYVLVDFLRERKSQRVG